MGNKSGTITVTSHWEGDMRAMVTSGDFEIPVDELGSSGNGKGPQPTDLLLGAVASCFTLAMVFEARKRSIVLPGLRITVAGTYDGPRFSKIIVSVQSDGPMEIVTKLIPAAERVCWVTNTLRIQPTVEIVAVT